MNRFELSVATKRKGDSKKAVAELKGVCTLRRHVYNKFTILSTAKVLVINLIVLQHGMRRQSNRNGDCDRAH
jgi:hypothetical protein